MVCMEEDYLLLSLGTLALSRVVTLRDYINMYIVLSVLYPMLILRRNEKELYELYIT